MTSSDAEKTGSAMHVIRGGLLHCGPSSESRTSRSYLGIAEIGQLLSLTHWPDLLTHNALQWDTSTDPDGSVLGDAIAPFAHQVRWGPHREAHHVNVNVNTRGIGRTCEMTRVIRSGICRKLDLTASWATHQSPMLKARDSDKSLKVVNDLQMHL